MKNTCKLLMKFCCACLLIVSCSDAADERSFLIVKKGALEFQLGMTSSEKLSGYFKNEKKERVYYFSNTVTSKVVKFFDNKGTYLNETPLNSVLKLGERIDDIDVVSRDSIVLLTQYTGKIYLLNKVGDIFFETTLNNKIESNIDFELYGPTFGKFVKDNYIVTGIGWVPDFKKGALSSPIDMLVEATKTKLKHPSIFKIPLEKAGDKEGRAFAIYNELFSDSSVFYGELSQYLIVNNSLLCWSWYSDNIVSLSFNKFELQKKLKVESIHTVVGIEPLKLNEEFLQNQNSVNEALQSGGHITGVYFNEKLKHYYVTVYLAVEKEKREQLGYRPWSLLVYDGDFKLLGEKKFASNNYTPYLFPSDGGFLIRRVVPKGEYSQNKIVFDYYEY